MDAPKTLTISDGALAMDGGSVFLDASDDLGQRRHILLDWSLAAQRDRRTCLRVDEDRLPVGGSEERAWIEAIASAAIAPTHASSDAEKIGSHRLVLASDAKAVFEVGARGPAAGLAALRDSLLEKICSTRHAPKA
jgi:hypothetical protein